MSVARVCIAIAVVACQRPVTLADHGEPSAIVVEEPRPAPPPPAHEPFPAIVVPDEPPPPPRTRVIIVSEDGMRPDAIDAANAPHHLALMREGMVARRAYTVRPSETLCAHASMLSGFPVADHKMTFDGFDRARGQIELPTIFSIAREHGLSTAMFIGKQKLWHIAPPGSVDHFEKPGFLCRTVAVHAARYFEANLPDLMFVHFTDPDNAGHERGWMSPPYMAAVRESDRCLRVLLDAIDRSGTATSTLLIVTADHGGSGRSHSGRGKELDRLIPWIARGPSIPPGSLLDVDVSTVDTAVTSLSALRLPTLPGMVGVSRLSPTAVLPQANAR